MSSVDCNSSGLRWETVLPSLNSAQGWCAAHRAAAWIDEQLSLDGFEALAVSLRMTRAELATVCEERLGASPEALLRQSRLRFSKLLLLDTSLNLTEIVDSANWNSEAEFRVSFHDTFGSMPESIRLKNAQSEPTESICLTLSYQNPFEFGCLLDFLRIRAIPGVEEVTSTEYRRTLRLTAKGITCEGWIRIEMGPDADSLRLIVSRSLWPALSVVRAITGRLFDLGADPAVIDATLAGMGCILPGLRVPGGADSLETAVRAVLGQQITVAAARTLAGRVAENLGSRLETPYPSLYLIFPDANTLASASQDQLGRLGILRTRIAAIHSLAHWKLQDSFALSPWIEPVTCLKEMKSFPGIGDWTAHYISMRVQKWADAFPAADYGVLHALGFKKPAEARDLADSWRPWRAYGVMQLWHRL